MELTEERRDTEEPAVQTCPRGGNRLGLAMVGATWLGLMAAVCPGVADRGGEGARRARGAVQLAPVGQADADPRPVRRRTLEADRIVLLDPQGRTRIELVAGDAGPAVRLLNEDGKTRLELKVTDNAPSIALIDSEGNEHATIRMVGDHASLSLGLHRPDQKAPVSLDSGPHDKAGLHLRDEAGETAASLTRKHDGGGRLELEGKKSSCLVQPQGLWLRDTNGLERATLAFLNGNFPVFTLSGKNRTRGPGSIEMTASDDGSCRFAMHRPDGFPVFSLFAGEKGITSLNMRHPDHDRSLQISLGRKEEDGPSISFFTPARDDGRGGILPKLQLSLDRNRQPNIRICDDDGKPLFTAP